MFESLFGSSKPKRKRKTSGRKRTKRKTTAKKKTSRRKSVRKRSTLSGVTRKKRTGRKPVGRKTAGRQSAGQAKNATRMRMIQTRAKKLHKPGGNYALAVKRASAELKREGKL